MLTTLVFLIDIAAAYLIGSVSSAIIVSRLFNLPDPRTEGSKNPGATNVLRLSGKKYAVVVLIADMLKGLLPLLLAHALHSTPVLLGCTCLAAVLGHIYPVFFEFKGGKGVATAIGAFLGFHPTMGIVIIALWILIANISRYSSLASITAVVFAPFYSLFVVGDLSAFVPLALITAVVLYQHRNNSSCEV
jgi:glycerol-3-phosphate acyltransferase PlsY